MEEEYFEEFNDIVIEIISKYIYVICFKFLKGEKDVLEIYFVINEKGKIGKEKCEVIIVKNWNVFDCFSDMSVNVIKYWLKEVVNYVVLLDDIIKLYK